MKALEMKVVLAYISAFDNRNITDETAAVWADALPEWITPAIAREAVKRFFTQPTENARDNVYFTTKHLVFHAKQVRREVADHQRLRRAELAIEAGAKDTRAVEPRNDDRIHRLRKELLQLGSMKIGDKTG